MHCCASQFFMDHLEIKMSFVLGSIFDDYHLFSHPRLHRRSAEPYHDTHKEISEHPHIIEVRVFRYQIWWNLSS